MAHKVKNTVEEVIAPMPQQVRVRNMRSPRTGSPVANQFIIFTAFGDYFQSYESVIACRDNQGQWWLDENKWDYSVTTSKYLNEFLGVDTAEKKRRIKSGYYKFADLNSA